MIQTEEQNVPALRFPEFEGEWIEERFEKSTISIKSGRSSHHKTGEFPVYGSTGQIGYSENYEFEQPAILVARVGANAGRINYAVGKFGVTDNTLAILLNEHTDFDFAISLLEKTNLNRFVFGSGQPLITGTMLKRIKCTIPTLPEQQKIAAFLSSVDRKIAQLGQKKALLQRYKKGMMQKLFSQELRFKDAQGDDFPDWEEKRLEEIFERVTRKNKENNTNVLTISAQMGLINQMKYFNHSVAAKDLTGYYLLEKGDFAYNKSYSKGYPMGAIKRLKSYDSGVVSTLYICFRAKNPKTQFFFEKLFDGGYQNRWIHKIAQEGARNHGLLNMAVGDFFGIPLPFPSLPEQQKIADFLSSIDRKIDLVSIELDYAKTFKKGLLQQMFI